MCALGDFLSSGLRLEDANCGHHSRVHARLAQVQVHAVADNAPAHRPAPSTGRIRGAVGTHVLSFN